MNDTASITSSSGSGSGSGDINPSEIAATPKNSATNDNNNENDVVNDDVIIGGVSFNDIITEIHDHVSYLLLLFLLDYLCAYMHASLLFFKNL